MENAYGIGVTNRYHLFLDDDADPLELLQSKERERELKKRSKGADKEGKGKVEPKPKATPASRKNAKESENIKSADNRIREEKSKQDDGKPERQQRSGRFTGENREDRNNRRNRDDSFNGAADKEWKPRREFGDNEGAERRTFGRGRGGRGGRGNYENRGRYDNRGKREHDSQQSDGSWEKRSGSKENADKWPKSENVPVNEPKQEYGSEEVGWDIEENVEVKEVTEPTDKSPEQDGENATEVPTVALEEEPKELTLDEWKAQRAVRQKPSFNLRKAGEGEDPSQWKKMYVLDKKREGNESELEEELEFDISDYPQRVGRQKHILDIQFTFNDARRGGGTGRGWGRGRGGRGQGRGFANRGERAGGKAPFKNDGAVQGAEERPEVHLGRGRQNAPKVDDEHDFPSLG